MTQALQMAPRLDARTPFIELVEQVIDCLCLPRPMMPSSESDALEIALRIDGTRIGLLHEPEINPGHFLVDARIGCVDMRRGGAQRVLIENSALLEHGWLTLGRHAGTNEVSYLALLDVTAARVEGVADCVRALARRARLQDGGAPAVPTASSETKLRPALELSSQDRRAAFEAQVIDLCSRLAIEPTTEETLSTGERCVTLVIDGRPVLLAHRTPVDAFFTVRGLGNVLPREVQEYVACRLLEANAEFAHEGIVAFALTPDSRRVIWRVTSRLPEFDVDELISCLQRAAEMADCADSDRPLLLTSVHMLA